MAISPLFLYKRLGNFVLVSCLLTTFEVSYWRGTWHILDLFVFSHDIFLSAWVTFPVSFAIIYLIVLVGDDLKAFLKERKAKKALYLALFYPLSFLIVTSWRGLWMLLDYYTTASLTSGCASHTVGFFIVLSTKTATSIMATPGYCESERNVDPSLNILERKNCLEIKTFRRWISDKVSAITTRMLNSFVTVFVIGSGVINFWRGTWIIVASIKPDDKRMSSVIALSLGFAICSFCYFYSTSLGIVGTLPVSRAASTRDRPQADRCRPNGRHHERRNRAKKRERPETTQEKLLPTRVPLHRVGVAG